MQIPFPNKRYQIILADPPWTYEKTGSITNSRGMAKQFYQTMSISDLCLLPVRDIAEDNAVLFLWTTWPQLERSFSVIRAWGFTYFGLGFEWIKKTITNKDHFGMGYYTRANSEPCLMAFRGKLKPLVHSIRQIVESPIQRHSQKPSEVRDKIVQIFGDLPRIEIFARQKTEGWDVWGNEVEMNIPNKLGVN
jgi:N6-adenosine-specific RNA methylase IME4